MKIIQCAEILKEHLGENAVRLQVPMRSVTTFKIGGPCDLMIEPTSVEGVVAATKILQENNVPFMTIGNGSNLLFSDKGLRGAVLRVSENLSEVRVTGIQVVAESGVLLSRLAGILMEKELTGFEFASGIPGTLGGAVYMNAGAYDGEMKDVVEWAEVLYPNGEIKCLDREALGFRYRHSTVMDEGGIVLRCGLKLMKGSFEDIRVKTNVLTEKRTSKQPLEKASAGSTFKRPEGYFAGKLIEDSGLRGLTYGGAQVSPKHCGFIVNNGGATAEEVLQLINVVRKVVQDTFGVTLETEIRIVEEEMK